MYVTWAVLLYKSSYKEKNQHSNIQYLLYSFIIFSLLHRVYKEHSLKYFNNAIQKPLINYYKIKKIENYGNNASHN